MYFVLPILLVIFFALILQYSKYFFKKFSLMKRLKRLCKSNGLKITVVNKLWFFSGIGSANCDLHIETPSKVYSIKICGVLSPATQLKFIDETTYGVRIVRSLYSGEKQYTIQKKRPYNFRYNFPSEAYLKENIQIMCMCPVARSIILDSDDFRFVGNGDDIGECLFYTRSGLIERIRNDLDSV